MSTALAGQATSLASNFQNAVLVEESRVRSRLIHRLDPTERRSPLLATQPEIALMRESSDLFLRMAGEEIDRLHAGLQTSQCAVLLAGPEAVVLDHRISAADEEGFLRHGSWTGGDWSEAVEGTNAVGTATAVDRAVMVRGAEHYNHRNSNFTCIGVPVHAPDGKFAGSLTVARPVADLTPAVVLAMSFTREAAAAIEQRQFRTMFGRYWVVLIRPLDQPHPVLLLAVDRDRRIVGASHQARQVFTISDRAIEEGLAFADLFPDGPDGAGRTQEEQPAELVFDRIGEIWQALVSPPARRSRAWLGGSGNMDPTRPRWLRTEGLELPAAEARNGASLSPHVLTRVIGHIEDHLDESLPLEELARIAGLRRSHFSQAFRGSTGMSPHRFVLERRIGRAKRQLNEAGCSVTDVALACGFASASHFATAFRAATGVTPREYRSCSENGK
jgi:transcriptional regulator of acetoin/glycerol metabolism/AraC-like DNA-binding protein